MGYIIIERLQLKNEIAEIEQTMAKIAQLELAKKQAAIKNEVILGDFEKIASRLYDIEQQVIALNRQEAKRLRPAGVNLPLPTESDNAELTGIGGEEQGEFDSKEMAKQWLLEQGESTIDRIESNLRELLVLPKGMPLAKQQSRLSSPYGYRRNPFTGGGSEFHNGLDFAASMGTPVYATANGVVEYAAHRGGLGKAVKIKHDERFTTTFGHLSKILVREGASVNAGELIGLVGSTGRSSGPHLHYIVSYNGKPINPRDFI